MRRIGSLAQDAVSEVHTGDARSKMLRSAAESDPVITAVPEFGPGSPPNSRRPEVLNAERVCQATAGPWDVEELVLLLTSCHGVNDKSKGVDNGR